MLPRQTRRERAAAAVEMAIVLPLLLLIVGGIIDFGRFFYTQNIVVNAAREGARSRALGYTTADCGHPDGPVADRLPGFDVHDDYSLVQGAANVVTANGDCPTSSPGPLDRQRVTVSRHRVHLHRAGACVASLRWGADPADPRWYC